MFLSPGVFQRRTRDDGSNFLNASQHRNRINENYSLKLKNHKNEDIVNLMIVLPSFPNRGHLLLLLTPLEIFLSSPPEKWV
jgi:hypothetical protein